ncbi:MAG TPA: L,D-transpeptidase family protein [Bdellovibrionota bacterium]|nr:L,D-transpeptidase family protein [Bdellovibrionota bacterium]
MSNKCTWISFALIASILPLAVPSAHGNAKVRAALARELKAQGLRLGDQIYIRVIKKPDEHMLEKAQDESSGAYIYNDGSSEHWSKNTKGKPRKYNSWMGRLQAYVRSADGKYRIFKTYPVRTYTGTLGPKTRQGDGQTPEGFYQFTRSNPYTQYVRSFDIGYPNAKDRALGHTGSMIAIHGTKRSDGCLAMGADITEIDELVRASRRAGHKVPVHIFPFEMTDENLEKFRSDKNFGFWKKELKPVYDFFEDQGRPPRISVKHGTYRLAEKSTRPRKQIRKIVHKPAPKYDEFSVGAQLERVRKELEDEAQSPWLRTPQKPLMCQDPQPRLFETESE